MYKRNFSNKAIISILAVSTLTSCAHDLISRTYSAIEPWKEWELELQLRKDSTFTLADTFGCNTFYYTGRWKYQKDASIPFLILTDTTPKALYDNLYDTYQFYNEYSHQEVAVKSELYFPAISNDTALVLQNENIILFRGLSFKRQKWFSKKNLSKKRADLIASWYIDRIGKKEFIKALGEGKGMAQALKNLQDCKPMEIPLRIEPTRDPG